MGEQIVPDRIWTRVGGTAVEAYQDSGAAVVLRVDPARTEITVPVASATHLRFRVALSRISDEDEVWGKS